MRTLCVVVIVVASLMFAGCGSGNNGSGNINGNWTASLTDSGGTAVFGFGTSLLVNNGGTLSVSNFNFTSNSACFVSGETESGSFVFSGNFNGNVSGTFQFNVSSGNPSGNTLTMAGTVNGNKISGTWTVTGGIGCTGNGNFVMTKA